MSRVFINTKPLQFRGCLLLAGFALLATLIFAQSQVPEPAIAAEVLTTEKGVPFSPFLSQFLKRVEQSWAMTMPQAGSLGDKQKIILRIRLRKDGTLARQPIIVLSSGTRELDDRATTTLHDAAPFPNFPGSFTGASVEIRVTFDGDPSAPRSVLPSLH